MSSQCIYIFCHVRFHEHAYPFDKSEQMTTFSPPSPHHSVIASLSNLLLLHLHLLCLQLDPYSCCLHHLHLTSPTSPAYMSPLASLSSPFSKYKFYPFRDNFQVLTLLHHLVLLLPRQPPCMILQLG